MAYTFNESYFDKIDTEEKAYWLGFIAADGGINIPGVGRRSGWVLALNLKKSDKYHLEKFQKAIERNSPIYETANAARLSIGSKKFILSLIKHGIGPQKSHSLRPWKGPKKLQKHYWRGVFDGDGSISKTIRKTSTSNYIVWMISLNGNRSMVQGFRTFLKSRGIRKIGHFASHYSIYKVKWAGFDSTAKVAKVFYDKHSVGLERKAQLFKEMLILYENKITKKRRV